MSDVIENTLQELKAFCAQRQNDYEEASAAFKAIADAYDEDFTYGEIKEWAKQSQAQIEDLPQIYFCDSEQGPVSNSYLAGFFDDYLSAVDATGSWVDLSADLCDRLNRVSAEFDEIGEGWMVASIVLPDLDKYSPNRLVYWLGSISDICDFSDVQKISEICEPLTGKI